MKRKKWINSKYLLTKARFGCIVCGMKLNTLELIGDAIDKITMATGCPAGTIVGALNYDAWPPEEGAEILEYIEPESLGMEISAMESPRTDRQLYVAALKKVLTQVHQLDEEFQRRGTEPDLKLAADALANLADGHIKRFSKEEGE